MSKEIRQIIVEGSIAYVPLTQGLVAVIDAEHAHLVEGENWFACRNRNAFYACRNSPTKGGKRGRIYMHRVLLEAPDGLYADHIDGDGLNNRSRNLRLATLTENSRNRRTCSANTSGFKGVRWDKRKAKWLSRIWAEGKRAHLGYFDTPEEAHAAYCAASEEYHGEFGRAQ